MQSHFREIIQKLMIYNDNWNKYNPLENDSVKITKSK